MNAATQNCKRQGKVGGHGNEIPDAITQALGSTERARNDYTNLKSCCLRRAQHRLLH